MLAVAVSQKSLSLTKEQHTTLPEQMSMLLTHALTILSILSEVFTLKIMAVMFVW